MDDSKYGCADTYHRSNKTVQITSSAINHMRVGYALQSPHDAGRICLLVFQSVYTHKQYCPGLRFGQDEQPVLLLARVIMKGFTSHPGG